MKSALIVGDVIAVLLFVSLFSDIYDSQTGGLIVIGGVASLWFTRVTFACLSEQRGILSNSKIIMSLAVSLALASLAAITPFHLYEYWLVVLIFIVLVGLLSKEKPIANAYNSDEKYRELIFHHVNKNKKILSYISDLEKPQILKDTLSAILIVELINRPKIVRLIESSLSWLPFVTSTGKMQVKYSYPNTDEESVDAASDYLTAKSRGQSLGTVYQYAKLYNGITYAKEVRSVDYILKELMI